MSIPLIGPRSDFSLGHSLLSPEEIVAFAAANGYTAVALTDVANAHGLVRFNKACAKHGIKPVVGAILRIFDDALDKTPPKKRETKNNEWHLKVYVKNSDGLHALYRLLSLAHGEERFYYVPRLSLSDVLPELSRGGLAVSSGDAYSAFSHESCRDVWQAVANAVGAADSFLELCPVATPIYRKMNRLVMEEHARSGSKLILSRPMLYNQGDADTLDVLKTITSAQKMADPWRPINAVRDFSLLTVAELTEYVRQEATPDTQALWLKAMMGNRDLADRCTYQWAKQPISLPVVVQGDERQALIDEVLSGWNKRLLCSQFGYRPTDLRPYADRLHYEIDTLTKMGFIGYFLLVQDLVKWAKSNGVLVGCGRGSAGGSLVAYLMGITDVDPIRFKLIFERFINPERLDSPDIDADFATSGRQRVVDYLFERYGTDRVAGITNYATLASASALRDTARVHGLSTGEYDCTKLVPKIHGRSHTLEEALEVGDIDAFRLKYPEIWSHAVKLQGKMRNYGTHAAGICVAGEPIMRRAPIIARSGFPVVAFDRMEVEDQGLIKMDILGLSTLDILRIACELIEKNHGRKIDLLDIALDDPKTLDAFGRGECVGVFQMEGPTARKLLKDMGSGSASLTIEDVIATNALNRPGPLDSGAADEYVKVKLGQRAPKRRHPKVDSLLSETNGVIAFQETIMRLAVDVCGFTYPEADALRKVVSKKQAEKMPEQRDRFVSGAKAGWVTVEMEDGSEKVFHKATALKVVELDEKVTIERVINEGLTLVGV